MAPLLSITSSTVRTDDTKILGGEHAAKSEDDRENHPPLPRTKTEDTKYKTGGQYQIQRGHRQGYTAVEVGEIQLS